MGSYVIQMLLDSLSRIDLMTKWDQHVKGIKNGRLGVTERKQKRADELEREEVCKANAVELDSIMHVVCFNVTSRTITPIAREALINLIMKNCKWEQLNWAERMFRTDAYHRLMEVASVVNMPEYKYESSIDITDSTKTIVGVTFGHLYEQMYDDKRRAQLVEVVSKYTEQQLLDPSMESKVRVVVGITTLLTNAPELGNSQLKDGLLEMMLVMAQSDDYIQQLVASEAIIAAASKKKDVTAIVKQGLDIVKSLYKCNNDHIKVRALVGLCKLGASGGSDATMRPFADGSSTKLAEACRRFLVNPGKDADLRRWAAEGLSYLTLDADVKEKLVEDEPAMKALIDLGKTGAQNVMYGVMATLVNITNSYDKQEINPEMLELAKFAKHHIPEEHELDDEDFADKRICTIAYLGVTTALVALAKTESVRSRILKDGNTIQAIENYMFEEHEMIRRAAVQCWTNLCVSDIQVKRCEGDNDKVKYCVLLCGDDIDPHVVKAASGALAMLTSASNKICNKVFESKQWNDCLLNLLANTDDEIVLRGAVIVQHMVAVSKDVAEKILETQVMEVLQALVLKANLDAGNAEPSPVLAKVKDVCSATLEEGHKHGIVRTPQEER